MQYAIYTIPLVDGSEWVEKLNKFLRSHRIISIDKEMIRFSDTAYWSFCIQYIPMNGIGQSQFNAERREKTDYKNLLSEEQFAFFCKLRLCRKQIAEEDAVPAYAVFTDAELAALAQNQPMGISSMYSIPGIGKKKVEKYGDWLLRMLQENMPSTEDEKSRTSD